jgi:DNA-binding transcriptional regulator YhcF (GntR family)
MWQKNSQKIHGLGPRAHRVFAALHGRIASGEWLPGTKLPSHRELAVEFGVAPMTLRQVLGLLEEQGLVSRQVGRGTFVRQAIIAAVLLVGHDQTLNAFLAEYIGRAGYRTLLASHLDDALPILADDQAIVLVLCDLDASDARDSVTIMETLRARWPQLPLVAMVADLGVLGNVFGTAAWPVHVLPKPIILELLNDVLRVFTPQTGRGG